MSRHDDDATELWRFETANLTVLCEALPEDMDPADSFDMQEDIDAVRSGAVDWFCARVRILHNETGAELASEYLGCCAYTRAQDFVTGHREDGPLNRNSSLMRAARGANVVICHYFPGMVAEACREARQNLAKLGAVRVRA